MEKRGPWLWLFRVFVGDGILYPAGDYGKSWDKDPVIKQPRGPSVTPNSGWWLVMIVFSPWKTNKYHFYPVGHVVRAPYWCRCFFFQSESNLQVGFSCLKSWNILVTVTCGQYILEKKLSENRDWKPCRHLRWLPDGGFYPEFLIAGYCGF